MTFSTTTEISLTGGNWIVTDMYPPKTTSLLRKLFEAIMETTDLDGLKQSCFVYYLVLEYGQELAASYAKRALLPEAFVSMMTGYYLMDNLDFEVHKYSSTNLMHTT